MYINQLLRELDGRTKLTGVFRNSSRMQWKKVSFKRRLFCNFGKIRDKIDRDSKWCFFTRFVFWRHIRHHFISYLLVSRKWTRNPFPGSNRRDYTCLQLSWSLRFLFAVSRFPFLSQVHLLTCITQENFYRIQIMQQEKKELPRIKLRDHEGNEFFHRRSLFLFQSLHCKIIS